ncbi:hypothetical protein LPJ60_003141 [Coemansia sp. RSA 2675]|nr:hypothetical protein LPJ60_003141 [Coemansia sp. RSA 2675]
MIPFFRKKDRNPKWLNVPPHGCSRDKLLAHLRAMQRMARVNSQWRAVAIPLLYRTVVIDIDVTGYKTKARGIGGNKGVRTNIGLYIGSGLASFARDMSIVVRGTSQTTSQFVHFLQKAGVGEAEWLGVERLCIDISSSKFATTAATFRESGDEDEKVFNKLLSLCLPSLREIHALGITGGYYSLGVPVSYLVNERLYGSTPLKALRMVAGGFPEREPLNQHRSAAPIDIAHLHVDHNDGSSALQLPPVLASSLVELTLNPVTAKQVWDPFVADGMQGSPGGSLVFSRLRSLSLGFLDRNLGLFLSGRAHEIRETDGPMSLRDGTPRYMKSALFGALAFPQLTSLEIRHFSQELTDFLSVFAACPISKLVIRIPTDTIPFDWDLSAFSGLRSFAIHIMRPNELDDMMPVLNCLSLMFMSAGSHLQELTVEMSICRGYTFDTLDTGAFGESLVSLTLKCEIAPEELDVVLGGYPNLKKLYLHAVIAQPISSTSELADKLRSLRTVAIRAPVCKHLRFLCAQGLRHYKHPSLPSSASIEPTTVAAEVALYRGLLLNLVCRLPSLATFQASATAFDGGYKCINMLTNVNVAPEYLDIFRNLKLQPIDG